MTQDRFAEIRVQFIEKLEAYAERIDRLLVEIEALPGLPDAALMAPIREIAHKVSGVAATLDYATLGEAAALLDVYIISEQYLIPANTTRTKELVALFLEELDFALEEGSA